MDALKKAEAAKRQGVEGSPASDQPAGESTLKELTLEPLDLSLEAEPEPSFVNASPTPEPEPAPAHLPKLPANLGGLDAEFVAHHEAQKAVSKPPTPVNTSFSQIAAVEKPVSPAPPAPAAKKVKANSTDAATLAERDAARNVFDAKGKVPPAGNKKFAIAMGILTISVTLTAVGYFWWQLQPKSGFSTSAVAVRPAAPPSPTAPPPTTAPAATTTATQTPLVAGSPATPTASVATAQTALGAASNPAAALTPVPAPVPMQAERKKRAEPVDDDNDMVRLVKVSKSPLKINPLLTSGFENFNRGNFAAAKTDYESVLKSEPQNTEALHGLAAIALREGRTSLADYYYERILVADPKDAAALSAMINLHRQNDPTTAESRLQAIAAEQPNSASTHFALGNLYASQKRWGDAQQAYFKAYSADADNPDILYNLAVSLEYLKQPRLAYQYYLLALEATARRPAGFDTAVAGARAAALKP